MVHQITVFALAALVAIVACAPNEAYEPVVGLDSAKYDVDVNIESNDLDVVQGAKYPYGYGPGRGGLGYGGRGYGGLGGWGSYGKYVDGADRINVDIAIEDNPDFAVIGEGYPYGYASSSDYGWDGLVEWDGQGWNGLGYNDLGWNGLVYNGRGLNGLGYNGLGWSGLGYNGLGWNGLGYNDLGWSGLGYNGLGWSGLGWNGLGYNGLGWSGQGYNGLGLGLGYNRLYGNGWNGLGWRGLRGYGYRPFDDINAEVSVSDSVSVGAVPSY